MNQGFKLRFDQMRDSDPTGSDDQTELEHAESYPASGHTRNLCLVWPDGRRAFFNYAYLVMAEFEPNSDRNVIRLSFSSHRIALNGYSLETLFMALLDHLPRLITATDARYVLDEDRQQPVVIEITVDKTED